MTPEDRRRRIKGARFPPSLEYPEHTQGSLLSRMFEYPVFVWAPESINASWKCPKLTCSCSPSIKGYQERLVDDVGHKTLLLFCKYQCRSTRQIFTTIGEDYLSQQAEEVQLQLPYILSHKFGVSKTLMKVVHDGITSRQGLRLAMETVEQKRQSRYLWLRSLFGARVRAALDTDPKYSPPMPPSLDQYRVLHRLPDRDSLTQQWLVWSEMYSVLSEMIMSSAEIKKVVRMDHSRKFTSMLKKCTSDGEKQGISNFRLLLLMQNECGQIVARALTASENGTETESVLREKILPRIMQADGKVYVVADNATAVRGVVNRACEGYAETKQDPFHVIQRFTDKVKRGAERSRIARDLSAALYSCNRQLNDPVKMGTQVEAVVDAVREKYLLCPRPEWERTLSSNLRQIERGDLFVDDNFYTENGQTSKVISTSQLEGVHCQLKKTLSIPVSIGVGLRVLDIFILQHNLRVGARWGRNPDTGSCDFVELCQSALLCSGHVSETPLYEFVLSVLARDVLEPRYRLTSAYDFPFRRWLSLYDSEKPRSEMIQVQLHQRPQYDIYNLMFRSSARIKIKDIPRSKLYDSLSILSENVEVHGALNASEFELLKQVRREMLSFEVELYEADTDWTDCPVATTILYNLAVSSNENEKLSIARRGYSTIAKNKGVVDELLKASKKKASQSQLFRFSKPRVVDSEHTAHERAIQQDLWRALKASLQLSSRRRLFVRLYWLAACMSPQHLNGKSAFVLCTRWDTLGTGARRDKMKRTKAETKEYQAVVLSDHTSAESQPEVATSSASSAGQHESIEVVCETDGSIPSRGNGGSAASQPARAIVIPSALEPPSDQVSRVESDLQVLSVPLTKRIRHEHMDVLVSIAKSYQGATGKWLDVFVASARFNSRSKCSQVSSNTRNEQAKVCG